MHISMVKPKISFLNILFVLVEIIKEYGYAFESRLALAFYFYAEVDLRLACAAEVLNLVKLCYQANSAACDNRLAEAHVLDTIVNKHLDVLHLDNLIPEVWEYRECEIAVSYGRLVWTFGFSSLHVYVNPLVVESCVCKHVDAVLVYLQPFACAEHFAKM